MQRVVHSLFGHALGEQTDALHHHNRIGSLDAHDDIAELLPHTNPQELHAAFHDSRRRIAIAGHNAVGQRTVVHADTQGGAMLTADSEKLQEAGLKPHELGTIFLFGICHMLETPRRINVVAGIDAHLLNNCCGGIRDGGIEVYVGHKGD